MVLEIIIQNCKEKRAQRLAARQQRLEQKNEKPPSPVCSDKGDADEQDLKEFKQLQLPDALQN